MNQSQDTIDDGEDDSRHIPVLPDDVLAILQPKIGESYLDATAGYGGHASRILARTASPAAAVLIDRDENAIQALEERFTHGEQIVQADFLSAAEQLLSKGKRFDLILADLGVSSPHLNIAARGFAIAQDGPLDMRMDPGQELTAADVVNSWDLDSLVRVLKDYGEEPKARAVAQAIINARPLNSTHELAKTVARVWPGHSKVHPATRTFQAIRIAVNDELGQLERAIPLWISLLQPGGRLAIISFHSLEDRLVKNLLAEQAGDRYDAVLTLLTKRPITAASTELVHNPRARSAKLRAVVKK